MVQVHSQNEAFRGIKAGEIVRADGKSGHMIGWRASTGSLIVSFAFKNKTSLTINTNRATLLLKFIRQHWPKMGDIVR